MTAATLQDLTALVANLAEQTSQFAVAWSPHNRSWEVSWPRAAAILEDQPIPPTPVI